MVKMPLYLFHGKVRLAADLTSRLADVSIVLSHECTDLAVKLIMSDLLEAIAGLVEACVALVTINH